jgi:hypothetical protein
MAASGFFPALFIAPRFADIAEAIIQVTIQAPLQQMPNCQRRLFPHSVEIDRHPNHIGQDVGNVSPVNMRLTGKHFIES